MESDNRLRPCKDFIDSYLPGLCEDLRVGKLPIIIDFAELAKFNLELAEDFLDEPEECLSVLRYVVEELDTDKPAKVDFGFANLPRSQEVGINKLRCKHLSGELIFTKGVIMTRTKVYPKIISVVYECPACGQDTTITQDNHLKEPSLCSCGRKGKFRKKKQEFVDEITIGLEELPEELVGAEQPYNVRVVLRGALCRDDSALHLGARVEFVGYMSEIPLKAGQLKSVSCDFLLHALNYKNLEVVSYEESITPEEQALFDEISSCANPAGIISKLIFGGIHGLMKVKEALIYQQFGGVTYGSYRDYIHILLYGHPGTAKTDLALKVMQINPISRFSTGTNISNVGLTASAKKDELTGNWMAVAGLLPKCNRGLAVIDEIEKMRDDDKRGLHTPMEHGQAPIDKAGISGKLVANTSILATSNPKVVGKPLKVVENLDLPSPILDRFDLIFIIPDNPDTTLDLLIARKLTERATFEQNSTTFEQNSTTFRHNDTTFHISTLMKYVVMCKRIAPKLSRRVEQTLHSWYVELRKASLGFEYKEKKPTPRALESVLRMARAITRSKLKDTITIKELQQAVGYFNFVYDQEGSPKVTEESVTGEVVKEEVSSTNPLQEEIRLKHAGKKEILSYIAKYDLGSGLQVVELVNELDCEGLIKALLSSGELVESRQGWVRISG